VAGHLRRLRADVLCCNGYKSDLVGWLAARQVGVPVVGIAHGWTRATWRVRCYEALDRMVMRQLDCTVCVSRAQAAKVLGAGIPAQRVAVIHNAMNVTTLEHPDPAGRGLL